MSIADELEKLNRLRLDGALTDAEYQQQKEKLLNSEVSASGSKAVSTGEPRELAAIPLKNRWWFQSVLTWLAIPAGIILMLCCTAYQKKKGQIVPVGSGTKALVIALAFLLWALGLARLFTDTAFQRQLSQSSGAASSGASNAEASLDPQRKAQLTGELRSARNMCHAQGTEDHPITVDELNEMAQNQDTYYSQINQLAPSLMTGDDRKCWQDARQTLKENAPDEAAGQDAGDADQGAAGPQFPDCDSAELKRAVSEAIKLRYSANGLPTGPKDLDLQLTDAPADVTANFQRIADEGRAKWVAEGSPQNDDMPPDALKVCSGNDHLFLTVLSLRQGRIRGVVENFGIPNDVAMVELTK